MGTKFLILFYIFEIIIYIHSSLHSTPSEPHHYTLPWFFLFLFMATFFFNFYRTNMYIFKDIRILNYYLLLLHDIPWVLTIRNWNTECCSLRKGYISCFMLNIPKLPVVLSIKCLHFKANKVNLGQNFILYFHLKKVTLIYFNCRFQFGWWWITYNAGNCMPVRWCWLLWEWFI